MPYARLSKSRIIHGLQCHKRLWIEAHRPELVVYDEAARRRFDVGHRVGEIAWAMHPGGRLIESQENLNQALRETEAALAGDGDMVLYEPTFRYAGVLVRVDILSRCGGVVRLIEVKSSASCKPYHVTDAAVQAWVLGGAGLPVDEVAVSHIDTSWVYPGNGDYAGLLVEEEVTAATTEQAARVWGWVDAFRRVLAGEQPQIEVGPQCSDPYECPLWDHCTADRPEYHVSLLPRGGREAAALVEAGYDDLCRVPADWPLSGDHQRVWRATVSGEPELDPAAREVMLGLAWPRFYLDFETINPAVPLWEGTRPYEQLPFQWSCHIEREGGALEHFEFLDVRGAPPMRSCAESLLATLGDVGSILVYTGFEQRRVADLAVRFPDLAPGLRALTDRLVDLHAITRRYYYHPRMKGSWSLKAVLPTVAPDLDHGALDEVRDGAMAQSAYAEAIAPQTTHERRESLRRALREYCALDTMALVRLAHFLERRRQRS